MCVRHGRVRVSILAGIELPTGQVLAHVKDHPRSHEFIALLRNFDDAYPPEATIRVVMEIKLHRYDLRYFGPE